MITVTVKGILIGICSNEAVARSFVRYFDKSLTDDDIEAIMTGKEFKDFKADYMPLIDEKFMSILKGN